MTAAPEFSRPLVLDGLPRPRSVHRVAASTEECASLARRFGIPAVLSLAGEVRCDFLPRERGLKVAGTLAARVRLTCVASLEEFDAAIETGFEDLFLHDPEAGEADPDALAEPWPGPVLDLGEILAQHLALAIDPHPRRPGLPPAAAPQPEPDAAAGRHRPFAGLKDLGRSRRS